MRKDTRTIRDHKKKALRNGLLANWKKGTINGRHIADLIEEKANALSEEVLQEVRTRTIQKLQVVKRAYLEELLSHLRDPAGAGEGTLATRIRELEGARSMIEFYLRLIFPKTYANEGTLRGVLFPPNSPEAPQADRIMARKSFIPLNQLLSNQAEDLRSHAGHLEQLAEIIPAMDEDFVREFYPRRLLVENPEVELLPVVEQALLRLKTLRAYLWPELAARKQAL